ncbi:MAG: hypothetical protein L3K26_00255 [Candidatus Hydrogenedentes bacterium]|nr:hypothetical protein [Candidatus Hydrogenedentota bacterium]
MGDSSDMSDIGRFIRSEEGQEYLESFAVMLRNQTIEDVEFVNQGAFVGMHLKLSGGGAIDVTMPGFDIGALRAQFEDVMEREYYTDYPARTPTP